MYLRVRGIQIYKFSTSGLTIYTGIGGRKRLYGSSTGLLFQVYILKTRGTPIVVSYIVTSCEDRRPDGGGEEWGRGLTREYVSEPDESGVRVRDTH